MGHKANLETVVYVNADKQVVISTTATWKNYSMVVYKGNIDTNEHYYQFDNSTFNPSGGWLFQFPGETYNYKYYGGKYTVKEQPLVKSDRVYTGLRGWQFTQSLEGIKNIILSVHPEYKYLFKKIDDEKYHLSKWDFFSLIEMWKYHPLEVECLSSKGLYTLALNNNLYKLSDKKKKSVLQALKELNTDMSLMNILRYIKFKDKYKLSMKEYEDYLDFTHFQKKKDSLEVYRYCIRKNISSYNYHDMLKLAEDLGHNINDDYWRYPNNPNEVHNMLVEQKAEVDRLRREELAKQENAYWLKLEEIKNKICKKPIDIGNGYTLFFPTEFNQWDKAATKLHQCIVGSKYYKKVASGKSLIFMIWKGDEPSSTFEIDYNKNILQAYADEYGHYNGDETTINPTEYESTMFNKFLETFKPRRLKEYLEKE